MIFTLNKAVALVSLFLFAFAAARGLNTIGSGSDGQVESYVHALPVNVDEYALIGHKAGLNNFDTVASPKTLDVVTFAHTPTAFPLSLANRLNSEAHTFTQNSTTVTINSFTTVGDVTTLQVTSTKGSLSAVTDVDKLPLIEDDSTTTVLTTVLVLPIPVTKTSTQAPMITSQTIPVVASSASASRTSSSWVILASEKPSIEIVPTPPAVLPQVAESSTVRTEAETTNYTSTVNANTAFTECRAIPNQANLTSGTNCSPTQLAYLATPSAADALPAETSCQSISSPVKEIEMTLDSPKSNSSFVEKLNVDPSQICNSSLPSLSRPSSTTALFTTSSSNTIRTYPSSSAGLGQAAIITLPQTGASPDPGPTTRGKKANIFTGIWMGIWMVVRICFR